MLAFEGVDKIYRGVLRRTPALRAVTFEVRAGEIVGLIGANGAGKTTAIHLALGHLHPTAGSIRVVGTVPGAVAGRSRLGWVPDEPIFPARVTARGLLDDWLAGHGRSPAARERRIDELLRRLGLEHAADQRISSYSLGMQQKVSLALALAHEPEMLILDEPFSALDHRALILVREMLHALRQKRGSVLISSHHLSELELVCDRVVLLSRGRVEREETLRGQCGEAWVDLIVGDAEQTAVLLRQADLSFLREWTTDRRSLTGKLAHRDHIPELVAFLVARGVRIESISERSGRLEEIYLGLTGDEGSARSSRGDDVARVP